MVDWLQLSAGLGFFILLSSSVPPCYPWCLCPVLFCVSEIATGNETSSPSDVLGDSLDLFGTTISSLDWSPRRPLNKELFSVTIEDLIYCRNGHENMVLHVSHAGTERAVICILCWPPRRRWIMWSWRVGILYRKSFVVNKSTNNILRNMAGVVFHHLPSERWREEHQIQIIKCNTQ